MSMKKRPAEGSPSIKNAPKPPEVTAADVDAAAAVYTDSLVHLGIGPFISKATFAYQGPTGTKVTPNLVLTMPTNMMVEAAKHILMGVSPPDSAEGFQRSWDAFLASIKFGE
ncbi:hypothetical protein [Luteibacter yeojuensis]|uniref:Uncharacterized protein n=1 Tax=Luteibacter yeojuensis TaxID=345309 RepID=A0A7X5QUA4_9GAMM|nr:hypothetical protein [Luteibacter yeojuensis]NID15417.1 hypothetical protein [Luteibacter yeojuensis]